MATTVKIKHEGIEYTLGFTKRTIKIMSESGFTYDKFLADSAIQFGTLFAGAFLWKHRNLRADKIDEIWSAVGDKDGFMPVLIQMYQECIEDLYDEPEDDAKKAVWEVVPM